MLSYTNAAQAALFTDMTLKFWFQPYFNQKYHVNVCMENKADINSRFVLKVAGRASCVERAVEEILCLHSLCSTKTFNEATGRSLLV